MKYRTLRSLNYKVSELSLGTYPFKGWWGEPLSDKQVMDTLYRALECGINLIDTADVYGLGTAESLVGKISAEMQKSFIVSTKGGRDFTTKKGDITKNFDTNYLSQALEASLQRLQRDCINIYFLHGPEEADIKKGEIFTFLDNVKKSGKVQSIGISVNNVKEIDIILEQFKPDILSIPYNYLSTIDLDDVVQKLQTNNIDLFVREPLAQGLLTGKYTKDFEFPANDHRSWKWTKQFWNEHEVRLNEFNKNNVTYEEKIINAFRFSLQNPYTSTVIFGAKSILQLEDNLKYAGEL
jgi:aryl-alcohol dehydrogenase-like predicted oxidoreductase